jgi:hypothetical protein
VSAAAGADTVVIDGCAIATVDAVGTEHCIGHVIVHPASSTLTITCTSG